MIAAIYARKSTDDGDRSAEARSTTRQIERARDFAERKGWTVDPRFIFTDENTSGAEWKHRPGFNALLAALTPRPPFDVLVVSRPLGIDAMGCPDCFGVDHPNSPIMIRLSIHCEICRDVERLRPIQKTRRCTIVLH